ncbi:MAG TPA: EamA family transporter, partial [Archangium sp.]
FRRERLATPGLRDANLFALLYLGACAVAFPASLVHTDFAALTVTSTHAMTLGYLGVIASGLGFFLWNRGATRVSPGTLAVMNNAKIPLAVAVSLLVFGEQVDLVRLGASGTLLAFGIWLANTGDRR